MLKDATPTLKHYLISKHYIINVTTAAIVLVLHGVVAWALITVNIDNPSVTQPQVEQSVQPMQIQFIDGADTANRPQGLISQQTGESVARLDNDDVVPFNQPVADNEAIDNRADGNRAGVVVPMQSTDSDSASEDILNDNASVWLDEQESHREEVSQEDSLLEDSLPLSENNLGEEGIKEIEIEDEGAQEVEPAQDTNDITNEDTSTEDIQQSVSDSQVDSVAQVDSVNNESETLPHQKDNTVESTAEPANLVNTADKNKQPPATSDDATSDDATKDSGTANTLDAADTAAENEGQPSQVFNLEEADWLLEPTFELPERFKRESGHIVNYALRLRLHINQEGDVVEVTTLDSSGNIALDRAMERIALSGKFEPFTDSEGRPTAGLIILPIRL